MRAVKCNHCGKKFRGLGASRVMRKMLFLFCPRCWSDRRSCEIFMDAASRRG